MKIWKKFNQTIITLEAIDLIAMHAIGYATYHNDLLNSQSSTSNGISFAFCV